MKKPSFGLLTLSALCASGATSLAWADAPYQQPPATKTYDTVYADVSQSIGVDNSVVATAVTSDNGNGEVVFYLATGGKNAVQFDPGNVHPAKGEMGIPLSVRSRGLSAVAVDPRTHSVYAAGETFNGTDYDCLIKKYDRNGNQIWSKTHDFYQGAHDFCRDVAVDGNGDVIVGGARLKSASSMAKLVKFDANGNLLAENSVGIENCGPSLPCSSKITKISVGSDGRIVALVKLGWFNWWIGTWDTNLHKMPGYATYSSSEADITPFNVAVDNNGNFYAVGWHYVDYNGTSKIHHKLIRFDEANNVTCEDSQLFGSVSFYSDWNDGWFGVTVSDNGHAYVTGSDQNNIIAMEYDGVCAPLWKNSAGAIAPLIYNGGYREIGHDIDIDTSGDLHITGQGSTWSNTHALTLKYSHL